jgi:hypothetical protein
MDVRDLSQKVDQARNRYREAQEDLKGSYDRDLENVKTTADAKIKKQSQLFGKEKTKLEEQNTINNEVYSKKAADAIERSQNDYKERLKDSTAKFETDRKGLKNNFNEKLTGISESYKKSMAENNRYEDQVRKSLEDRYAKASKDYQKDFTGQIKNLDAKSKSQNLKNKEMDRNARMQETGKHNEELENLRVSNNEQKFKEVNRLRDDNESLRTTLTRENALMKDRHEDKVADLVKSKEKDGAERYQMFGELQKDIREKNLVSQEKQNKSHRAESQALEKKFNEDVRNIQSVANQKIKGGTSADSLHDELKQTKISYDNRLKMAYDELGRVNKDNSEKEDRNDIAYREKIKDLKNTHRESLAETETEARETFNSSIQEVRERNDELIDRYKNDLTTTKKDSENRLADNNNLSKKRITDQRVEFGRVVNTLNDKNMETLSAIKEDYSKDKTEYFEKAKKDFSEEKMAMKSEFNRQGALKETVYEQRLAEMEKQASKIIENYEQRISQIVRKAENEVSVIKSKEQEKSQKEAQSNKIAVDMLRKESEANLVQMRDKYQGEILRDRTLSDLQTNQIVQKYEDQLGRERADHQREMSMRLNESRAQFERLAKSVELEKETQRNQYEQRIENMRIASLAKEHSKKV